MKKISVYSLNIYADDLYNLCHCDISIIQNYLVLLERSFDISFENSSMMAMQIILNSPAELEKVYDLFYAINKVGLDVMKEWMYTYNITDMYCKGFDNINIIKKMFENQEAK